MESRLNPFDASPGTMKAMMALETHVRQCGLDHGLVGLVKTRASQINGCAYCIHMHTRDARAAGESADRLHLLSAWRESPLYTPRERAALAWTEALTLVAATHAPDDVYDEACRHFTPEELVKLTVLVGTINAWNRITVGLRSIHPTDGQPAPAGSGA